MSSSFSNSFVTAPSFELAQLQFALQTSADSATASSAMLQIQKEVTENRMLPFYQNQWLGVLKQEAFLSCDQIGAMQAENDAALASLEKSLEDAKESLGESDVVDAMLSKVAHFCKIGDLAAARENLALVAARSGSASLRLDAKFTLLRLAFIFADPQERTACLEEIVALVEEAGDWERRNRLRIYQGLDCLLRRDFETAATLFTASLSTFSSTAGCLSLPKVCSYAVLASLITQPRAALKATIVENSEVSECQCGGLLSPWDRLLGSLYEAKYAEYFATISEIEPLLRADLFLSAHSFFIMRELRITAYRQLLRSYRVLSLQSMARSFGISDSFLEDELGRFIVAGRLNCTIDKISNTVETVARDKASQVYHQLVRESDLLVSRLQRLSRTVGCT